MSSVFSSQDQFCPFWDQFCGFAYIIRLGDHTFAAVQVLFRSRNCFKSSVPSVNVPTQVGTLTQVVTSVHLGRPT